MLEYISACEQIVAAPGYSISDNEASYQRLWEDVDPGAADRPSQPPTSY